MATDKQFTTKTASLRATKIDTSKITLRGKNILDYISDSEFNSYDTRDPQLKNDELDIWNTGISLSEEGHIEVKPKTHGLLYDGTLEHMSNEQLTALRNASKIIDNEVLDENDNHVMYWQTDGLTDGEYIFHDYNTIVSFNSDLSSLVNGGYMFYSCTNLTSFNGDLSSLTDGHGMFYNCTNLTSFPSDLSNLTNGYGMFSQCPITSFPSDLSNLTDGSYMFDGCSNLESFSSDLSSLTTGEGMFWGCTALESFSSDLSSLTNGYMMFYECSDLASFNSDLSNLTDSERMFMYCANLTSFGSALPSLTDGERMFHDCKLDAQSVANIVHTLPTHESTGYIDIGVGCDNTEADQLLFAQECDCETWQELLDEFSAKNWSAFFELNGRPTTTYDMRRGETLPIYAKLEEVIMSTDEKKHKPHYAYTSADGSKFYNIHYFHSTNGSTEGYDVFSSLEEAISTYNVTPKN